MPCRRLDRGWPNIIHPEHPRASPRRAGYNADARVLSQRPWHQAAPAASSRSRGGSEILQADRGWKAGGRCWHRARSGCHRNGARVPRLQHLPDAPRQEPARHIFAWPCRPCCVCRQDAARTPHPSQRPRRQKGQNLVLLCKKRRISIIAEDHISNCYFHVSRKNDVQTSIWPCPRDIAFILFSLLPLKNHPSDKKTGREMISLRHRIPARTVPIFSHPHRPVGRHFCADMCAFPSFHAGFHPHRRS